MTNPFREALIKNGIHSGADLADAMDSPAVIFFFASPHLEIPCAELWSWDDKGVLTVRRHEPRYGNMTLPAMRRKTVQAAREDALERLGIADDWVKGPFEASWFPRHVLDKAREEYLRPEAS